MLTKLHHVHTNLDHKDTTVKIYTEFSIFYYSKSYSETQHLTTANICVLQIYSSIVTSWQHLQKSDSVKLVGRGKAHGNGPIFDPLMNIKDAHFVRIYSYD